MAAARKKDGPTELIAEKISIAGCANSVSETTQLKFGTEQMKSHQMKGVN